jgi:thioesterase domain-containing protein
MSPSDERTHEKARAEIAATLTKIWTMAIGRSDVGPHSDFYFDGGNHFIAPAMIRSINEALGMELTVRDLEQARTIARLTDLIHLRRARIDRSTVVPLRNVNGSRPPLFVVHGEGGHVLGFYWLAKSLDPDQPVYGIQAQALVPGEEALLRVEDMAARYIEDMRAISPHGPYHLLGLSFGGLVAYEIAQQLRAAGLSVGLLGMLDTRQPREMRGLPGRGPLHRRIYWRMKLVYLDSQGRKERLRYFGRRLNQWMHRVNYMYAASKGLNSVASTVRNVRQINRVAGLNYTVRPYPGKVTLFRAEDDPSDEPLPRDLKWGEVASGGFALRELPGAHGRLLSDPWLSLLARELTAALKEADAAKKTDRVAMEI